MERGALAAHWEGGESLQRHVLVAVDIFVVCIFGTQKALASTFVRREKFACPGYWLCFCVEGFLQRYSEGHMCNLNAFRAGSSGVRA